MNHKELLDIGFKLYGVEENDPYYHISFKPPFKFSVYNLSGSLNNGVFHLYGNDKAYTNKDELLKIVNVFRDE